MEKHTEVWATDQYRNVLSRRVYVSDVEEPLKKACALKEKSRIRRGQVGKVSATGGGLINSG